VKLMCKRLIDQIRELTADEDDAEESQRWQPSVAEAHVCQDGNDRDEYVFDGKHGLNPGGLLGRSEPHKPTPYDGITCVVVHSSH